jgi:hypothetical protein
MTYDEGPIHTIAADKLIVLQKRDSKSDDIFNWIVGKLSEKLLTKIVRPQTQNFCAQITLQK